MRHGVVWIAFVLACRHAAPADRAGRGIPTDLTAFEPPHVACPMHFADAHGVCTTNGGESDRCRYPEGTCRCERPCSSDRHFEAVLYLHRHGSYAWTCTPAVGPDGCPSDEPKVGAPCIGSMNCMFVDEQARCGPLIGGTHELSCWRDRWVDGWRNPVATRLR